MNLVPANKASIEVSLQLLLQPLEKGGSQRSCPQLPHKPLTLSGLQCPLARCGQRHHFSDIIAVWVGRHPVLNHSVQGGLCSTGAGSVTPGPIALLGYLSVSWNPTTIPKTGHRLARTPDSLPANHSTGFGEARQPLEMQRNSHYLDPGLGSRHSEDAFRVQPSFFQTRQ